MLNIILYWTGWVLCLLIGWQINVIWFMDTSLWVSFFIGMASVFVWNVIWGFFTPNEE